MQNKPRFSFGLLIFALLFFYFGVRVYFVFFHVGSYDGWQGEQRDGDAPAIVTKVDPQGPATLLQPGDELLALNGERPQHNPSFWSYAGRMLPGTPYTLTVRRNGQELTLQLTTVETPARQRPDRGQKVFILIYLIFLLTGLFVFLLKPDNQQAWYLGLMLGTFTALSTWSMPLLALGRVVETVVRIVTILGLWSLPLLVRFFLIFPDRSPILKRWPKIERYLYWPFYIGALPFFGGARLPELLRYWYFDSPPIKWLNAHHFLYLPMPTLIAYMVAGMICLIVNYRVAGRDARRRLRVIMFGAGLGFFTLLLALLSEAVGWLHRLPQIDQWIEACMALTMPLIPLSFAYAIIRHKVIPISLMIRRGVRYLLVSRGAVILEFLTVMVVLTVILRTIMMRIEASHLVVGIVSGVVSIVVWQMTRVIHNRYLAPLIDRKFFRQSYNAQQIMAELSEELRMTTDRAQLPQLVATKIQAALQTERVTILLKDAATNIYTCAYSCDYAPRSPHSTTNLNGHQLTAKTNLTNRLQTSVNPLEVNWDGDATLVEEVDTLTETEIETLRAMNSALLLPLKGKTEMTGIISLGARLGDLPFSNEDKRLLLSVSAPMSFALENTRLIEQMIEEARRREELEAENEARAKELEEARQLQLSMLPKRVPELPDLEIAAYMKTATEVGGDYYDFHVAEDGTLTVAVGDATGHGLKAGTVVTATKSLFHELATEEDLPEMLTRFSRALKQMNLRSLFMALTIVKVKANRLTLTVAGMPPILIYRAADQSVEEVFLKALPLGSIAKYNYKQQELALATGDLVVLMSDGFPERFNEAGEMFGYETTQTILTKAATLPATEIIQRFVQLGDDWAKGKPQDDDVTFVVLKVK